LVDAQFQVELGVKVLYSSTCPCSAALARQLFRDEFLRKMGNQPTVKTADVAQWLSEDSSTVAVPHSQRSMAEVKVALFDNNLSPLALINRVEASLGTPVQGAVKRVDEQEFARLNAENLMFCEDAARRMKAALAALPFVVDFRIQASHLESLHPHDAVAITTKGVPGGCQP